jgi:hypothetical protein
MRTNMKNLRLPLQVVVKKINTILLLLPAVLVMASAMSAEPGLPEASQSAAAFKQLTSLVGEWEAIQEGAPVKETYTLTAKGSVLMSETKPADSEPMITMFSRRRSPDRFSLLRRGEPAANGHTYRRRLGKGWFDVFVCARDRNEDARRLAQYRPDGEAG